jgi:hypothetical protein
MKGYKMNGSGVVGLDFRIGDIFERVLSTAVQVAVASIPTTIGVIGSTGALASGASAGAMGKAAVATGMTAGIAAGLSLVKNLFSRARVATANTNIGLRFLWTFVFAFVAALPTGDIYLNLNWGKTALLAALTAGAASVVSLAKNLTATGVVIDSQSASSGQTTVR